jgi:serine protease Do
MKLSPIAMGLAGAGLLVAGTAGALGIKQVLSENDAPAPVVAAAAPTLVAAAPTAPVAALPAGATPNYRAIVERYGPAVVGVTVEGTQQAEVQMQGLPPGAENDPFFQFFRGLPGFEERFGQRGGQGGKGGRDGGSVPFHGMGSGFIVGADGVILTNAHVVRNAKEVTVKLNDRREYKAKVLGMDPATDIAVLRIDAKNLQTVRLGDPKQLQVGDPVLAIGAPFGFEQTATQGIVSAKGRSLPGDAVVPFIQTDAAVNPGNSGGPLFDGSGNVIGINAQIYSQTGGYQGLAFSIPIDVALRVKDQIVATGKAQHARLGVAIQDLNQTLAESFGLPRPDGALVANVAPKSPAAAAGLKSGDVILAVDGEAIERSGALSSRIGLLAPGEKVTLKVWRDKAEREVDVKLGNADEGSRQAAADATDADDANGKLGLALRPLSAGERKQAKVEQGLLVEDVGGLAARAGVQQGDVLLAINGRPVDGVEQVRKLMAEKPKSVALLIERDGERIFVPVNLAG